MNSTSTMIASDDTTHSKRGQRRSSINTHTAPAANIGTNGNKNSVFWRSPNHNSPNEPPIVSNGPEPAKRRVTTKAGNSASHNGPI